MKNKMIVGNPTPHQTKIMIMMMKSEIYLHQAGDGDDDLV